MTVTRRVDEGQIFLTEFVIGRDLPVLPNNHGPQTDRLIYGLGTFQGYDSGDPSSREVGLYDQAFVDTYIHTLGNGGRIIAGQFDDPYQLDEKGIFDLVNLTGGDLGGIPGARRGPAEDVFTGFNLFSIALEVPMSDIFPDGIPHNGTLDPNSTDSLIRVWSSISRQATQKVDARCTIVTGQRGSGGYAQVGRNALPLFNAGLIGTQRQTEYLRSTPQTDVSKFANDILYPVLVRDAEALGIYAALGVPASTVATLKGPRLDIINAINLGRPIPVADGFTGDVITLDAATDSQFPNGRRLGGGTEPNRNQVNVNSRADQPDRRRRPGRRPRQRRRNQRQELPRPLPLPGPRPPGPASRATAASTPRPVPDIPDPDALVKARQPLKVRFSSRPPIFGGLVAFAARFGCRLVITTYLSRSAPRARPATADRRTPTRATRRSLAASATASRRRFRQ